VGVTPHQGDGNADHRAKGGRETTYVRDLDVIEMMQVKETRYQEEDS
jgi:hypothetical protein